VAAATPMPRRTSTAANAASARHTQITPPLKPEERPEARSAQGDALHSPRGPPQGGVPQGGTVEGRSGRSPAPLGDATHPWPPH
jgi:hypothetical protein